MNRDHSKLICDVGELTALLSDASGLDSLLQKIVEMTASHMAADVCSVYLYYEENGELVLKATKGLDPSSIGGVRLKLGEGLTGKALLELRPVCEGDAQRHPQFRHFTGIGEERFCSFLAVPIMRGTNRIGAMTLQSVQKNYFSLEDVNVFRAITSQLANTIEMAKILMSIEQPKVVAAPSTSDLKFVKGRVGAEGFGVGEAVVVSSVSWEDTVAAFSGGMNYGLKDLRRAVRATEEELEKFQKEIEGRLFDVASLIFSAQILMLKDQAMLAQLEILVMKGADPVAAIGIVFGQYVARFERMSDNFIREKRFDVIDVGRRLLFKLTGSAEHAGAYARKVVIASELLPSDAVKLSSQDVAGIVLLSGGVTSHVSVLARSLNIPLIISDERRLLSLAEGTCVLLDGAVGDIYVAPEADILRAFREKEELRKNASRIKGQMRPETRTRDGIKVKLLANINLLGDVPVAREYLAEGVGLYRTEFPFIVRSDFPTEEEQFLIYRRLVEGMAGREVTFRTLDIGGDKILSYYDYGKEANPFLGLRSIRFSLRHKDIFAQQIRAILRASAGHEVRIMFPMISSLDELLAAKSIMAECQQELQASKVPHQSRPVVGVMIELPSAVEMIDALAEEAEFFSIGTNDLIQYTLAVDRTNEKVAELYLPHHPAVLRSLARITVAAERHGRDVSVCGDMAHEPRYIPFFLGLGVRKFSLDARYLPKIQEAIMATDIPTTQRFSREALTCVSIQETARLFL